jgi:hypothetical protein
MKHIAPAVCLVLLLIMNTHASGQGFGQPQPRCCVCKQILFGDYLTIEGRYYHRDHFRCAYCNQPCANFYLLTGMPETEMVQTLAHELMHVWQGVHNSLEEDDTLREGSANYAAYLVMKRMGSKEAQFVITCMLEDPSPVYGGGFRRVKKYGDKHGARQTLELIAGDHPVIPDD